MLINKCLISNNATYVLCTLKENKETHITEVRVFWWSNYMQNGIYVKTFNWIAIIIRKINIFIKLEWKLSSFEGDA